MKTQNLFPQVTLLIAALCCLTGCPRDVGRVQYGVGSSGIPSHMLINKFSIRLLDAGPSDICSVSKDSTEKAVKIEISGTGHPSNEYGGWPDMHTSIAFSTEPGESLFLKCSGFNIDVTGLNGWGDVVEKGSVDSNCKLRLNSRLEIKRVDIRLRSAPPPLLMGHEFVAPDKWDYNPLYKTTIRCPIERGAQ